MLTKIEIINLALGILGCDPVTSLESTEQNAQTMSRFWPLVYGRELRQYDWNFSRKTVALALAPDTVKLPPYRFIYVYPANVLDLLSVGNEAEIRGNEFEIFAASDNSCKYIATDVQNAMAKYISSAEEPNLWPFDFAACLIYGLAAMTAWKITGNDKLVSYAEAKYAESVAAARLSNRREAKHILKYDDETLRSRG